MAQTDGLDYAEETVRLLAILVRQQSKSQSDAIAELHKAGFGPTRIADLLGTTSGTVNVAVNRSKRGTQSRRP